MTTATTKKPADPIAELRGLEEELETARRERNEVKAKLEAQQGRINALRAQRLELTISDPGQFNAEGHGKPKTVAREIEQEIEKVAAADYAALLHGAESRLQAATAAVESHQAREAEAVQRELLAPARATNAKIIAACQAILDETAAWADLQHQASARCHVVAGLDARDVPESPLITDLRRLAQSAIRQGIALPLSRSLVPRAGQTPPRVRSVHGGFVAPNAKPEDIDPVQPTPIEEAS